MEAGTAFNGTSVRSSTMAGNGTVQVQFDVADLTPWNLSNTGCSNDSNKIYCYSDGAGGYGVLAPSGVTNTVNATNIFWQVTTPISGTDYSGSLLISSSCTPVTTCP